MQIQLRDKYIVRQGRIRAGGWCRRNQRKQRGLHKQTRYSGTGGTRRVGTRVNVASEQEVSFGRPIIEQKKNY